uniref:RUN domain-containing protein n=1 Tax=Timema douglasi TaxID=61478 RepID=A0A7R8VR18_TIMDO|nr:unnamed protein product [Timema douglasi]
MDMVLLLLAYHYGNRLDAYVLISLVSIGGGRLNSEEVYPHLRRRVENFLGKITLNASDQDLNPNLPVIGTLVQHESDASDHAATEAGAVEACLSQGLRRRALGLFKTSSTTALLHKVGKTYEPASVISRKIQEIENADPNRRSSSSGDSTNRLQTKPPLQKKNSTGTLPGPKYLWIRIALFEKQLAKIIDHLVQNSTLVLYTTYSQDTNFTRFGDLTANNGKIEVQILSVHVLWIIPKQRRKIISGQTLLLTNWFKDIASPVDTPLLHHVADQLLIFDAVYMLQAQRKGIDNYRCQQKIM